MADKPGHLGLKVATLLPAANLKSNSQYPFGQKPLPIQKKPREAGNDPTTPPKRYLLYQPNHFDSGGGAQTRTSGGDQRPQKKTRMVL